jgi:hypothetical protein
MLKLLAVGSFFWRAIFFERGIHFVAIAHIVGWFERDAGTIYVGFAYLKALYNA